ncbi:hypothetical protein BP6252_02678 [Coleophoma cylindrospora]|uniref:3-carboxy-cis,cis-mucoante lactonizing enzyme n=1 Tax=Coleophoma cylindrospora TaxID=1849047 RepID=A0A3D8SH56_9HELO|nr:hypothetical protein BP6252_02678 [Coleophoma cylindrospora]
MHRVSSLFTAAALCLIAPSTAVNLYAAAADGNVTTLSLTRAANTSYQLSITAKTAECESYPSWLGIESKSRTLYCLDRGLSDSVNGSLNSFNMAADGSLTRIDRVLAPLSGVGADIFMGKHGKKGIMTASYNRSTAAVFEIDVGGIPGALSNALYLKYPVLNATGPVLDRQDRSYLHEVIHDPSRSHLFTPDLGGDRIRVWNYDPVTLAPLTELAPLVTGSGVGPRHGVFWTSPSTGELFLIFVGELDQNVHVYRIVTNTAKEVTWEEVFKVPAMGTVQQALNAPASEIALSPDCKYILVSNREQSFSRHNSSTDTLSTFLINPDGTLTLHQLAPTGGYLPRQFSINKAGDMVAIGHQVNNTVVVWERDIESGMIVTEGGPLAQAVLSGNVVMTIWDD